MFIVIKSEHYDCTNLICKKDTLEEAVTAVKDSMAQRINKNYHAGLTGTDITHENEDHYGFSFTFDENRNADSSEPRAYSTYDYWNGDDQESVEWVVYEVTTDKPFFLLSYEEYESIKLTGFYDTFDEAFGKMKELIAESVNDVFDEDATADDVEDMEDYNVFVHSNKDSQDNGAPLAFASFCDDCTAPRTASVTNSKHTVTIWQEIAGNTASRTKTAMSLIPAVALSATTLKRTVY